MVLVRHPTLVHARAKIRPVGFKHLPDFHADILRQDFATPL